MGEPLMMKDLFGLSKEEVENFFETNEQKSYCAQILLDWIYKKNIFSFEAMSNLSKSLRRLLSIQFCLKNLQLLRLETSEDCETMKYLWRLSDHQLVESVLICSGSRRTVCISSQIGCPARCAFCASGKEGFFRNLKAAEIVEQVLRIEADLKEKKERVTHLVFMGMGEPLENYKAVIKAIKILTHPSMFGISCRRVTISTVGVVEGIEKLLHEEMPLNLALSLHAPNQHLRKKLIPYARRYPLDKVLQTARLYAQKSGRDLTYEYILIKGVNDSPNEANELAKLLDKDQCSVNLIPFNPVDGIFLKRSDSKSIDTFFRILSKKGINVTLRYTKGKDIQGACGQLALKRLSFLNENEMLPSLS